MKPCGALLRQQLKWIEACIVRARRLKGPLAVDVNEQNPAVLHFYEALGFRVQGRSPVDGAGRPFPLLHLAE